MDNWQPTTLSWSYSRQSEFNACRRSYFYNRFWGQDPKLKWKLFEMRQIVTLAMLRGQVAHAVIGDALRSVEHGVPVDPGAARRIVTEAIQPKYMESKRRLWHIDNRPKDRKIAEITNLLEHYYKFPVADVDRQAKEARDAAAQCVENLMTSELWQQIAGSDTQQWNEIDDDKAFNCFDLGGIQVYARVDFAHSCGGPSIIDWKTGASSEQDRRQLVLYSLYAQSKWEWEPEQTSLTAVYLHPELKSDSFRPTSDELAAVKAEVKQSFDQMMELEPAFGPADINLFPETTTKAHCRWCRFQGACGSDSGR